MGFRYQEQIITENIAYKAGIWIKPQGVFLHSLGCPGMTTEEAIKNMNIGVDSTRMAVHAIIDRNTVTVTLPIDPITKEGMRNIHGGLSSNDTHLGVEMTEPDTIYYIGNSQWINLNSIKTQQHLSENYNTAVEYVAQLCQIFEWDIMNPFTIMTHKSGYEAGIATAYSDPEHIWDKTGFSLKQFRQDVQDYLKRS